MKSIKKLLFGVAAPILLLFGLSTGHAYANAAVIILMNDDGPSESEIRQNNRELKQIRKFILNYDFNNKKQLSKDWNVITDKLLFFKQHNSDMNDSRLIETKTQNTAFKVFTGGMTDELDTTINSKDMVNYLFAWLFIMLAISIFCTIFI